MFLVFIKKLIKKLHFFFVTYRKFGDRADPVTGIWHRNRNMHIRWTGEMKTNKHTLALSSLRRRNSLLSLPPLHERGVLGLHLAGSVISFLTTAGTGWGLDRRPRRPHRSAGGFSGGEDRLRRKSNWATRLSFFKACLSHWSSTSAIVVVVVSRIVCVCLLSEKSCGVRERETESKTGGI